MYLLDTNICIACLKGNRTVIQKITEHPTSCAIPIIVVSELFKGAHCSQKVEHNLDALIGAIARSQNAVLVTHNTKDFINIPALKLEDWLI